MNNWIEIKNKEYKFKLRSAGILIKNEKVLLVDMNNRGFLCLPGGYVELGETTEEALLRELKEETKKKFQIEKYCGVLENYFIDKEYGKIHEISFYYLVSLKEKIDEKDFNLIENDNGNIVNLSFKWISLKELNKYNVKPKLLQEILNNNLEFKHLIYNEFN